MSTVRELLEPTRTEQDAAQERIIESLTTGQYDGVTGSVRDAYDRLRSWYERGVRDAVREDIARPAGNTVKGAVVEQKLRATGMDTAGYDYMQVRVGPDREELRFLGEESRTIALDGHSVARQVYDSVRNADERSVTQVVEEAVVRNAVRQEVAAARGTRRESDADPDVLNTYVFPR